MSVKRSRLAQTQSGIGGFIPEADDLEQKKVNQTYEKDEELTDDEAEEVGLPKPRRKKRRHPSGQKLALKVIDAEPDQELIPLPPDQAGSICDQCNRRFETSFLQKHFDVDVCDACR